VELLDFADRTIDTESLIGPVNRVSNELTEVADGLAVVESFSHVWVVRTGEGLVLFDASGDHTGAKVVEAVRRWSADPVHTIVYTHGHIDHVGGAAAWLADAAARGHGRPRIVGHENVARRLERYRLTNHYNVAINQRQFGPSRRLAIGDVAKPFVPEGTPAPDVEYAEQLDQSIGGERFVLRHARGETDDHTWTEWVGRDTLFVGDFLIWNFPNCGNPQKVLRYPAEWAAALRAMLAHGPELVAPAHGLPVRSSKRATRVLGSIADALDSLVAGVIELLNADATLDDALHTVRVPDDVLELPWMRPFYDEPEFVVRNIWRTYGGWWDADPAHLLPPRAAVLAGEVVALAGGVGPLVERAQALAAAGDERTAAQLVEWAVQAVPDDPAVHRARCEIYAERRRQAQSLMAKGIFEAAARQSADRAGIAVPEMSRTSPLG
jgi:alkyl sulfatase BDS1-like metallo-beta-lactamase superfamily hydrolase